MSGFIALHREAMDHHLFKGDVARFGAWIWMVSKACWKETKFDVQGRTITLRRGQFCCSVRDMATAWGWPKSNVDRFLTRLKTETMIETESGTGRLIITICNYAKYQDLKDQSGTATGTATGTAAGQQRDIKEQGNKGTIEEEPIGSPSKGSANPKIEIPDWIPSDAWAAYIAMRKSMKKAPTDRAVSLLIGKLSKLRDLGNDPGAVLYQSTLKNWTDVYEIKDEYDGNRNQGNRSNASGDRSFPSRGDGAVRAALRRMESYATGKFAEAPGRSDDDGASGHLRLPYAEA